MVNSRSPFEAGRELGGTNQIIHNLFLNRFQFIHIPFTICLQFVHIYRFNNYP